jgi:hypothetical protein
MLIIILFTKYTHLETYLDMKGSPGLLSAGLQMSLHNITNQWSDYILWVQIQSFNAFIFTMQKRI